MLNIDFDNDSLSDQGQKDIAIALSKTSPSPNLVKMEEKAWQYYYMKQADDAYDYLLKDGEYTLPAIAKFYPVQRGYINLLLSTYQLRPFVYNIYASNREAVKKKYDNRLNSVIKQIMALSKERYFLINGKIEIVQAQIQELDSLLTRQFDPEDQQRQEQIAYLRQILPSIKSQFFTTVDLLKSEKLLTSKDIDDLERYQFLTKKDFNELRIQKAAKSLRERLKMKEKGRQAFLARWVAGRSFFFVNYDADRDKLDYEFVNSLKVTYPEIESISWAQNLPWCKISDMMSSEDIISQYGHELTDRQKGEIRAIKSNSMASNQGGFLALPGGYVMDLGQDASSGKPVNNLFSGQGIRVDRIWWKAQREILAVESPNPHRKGKFTHFVPDDRIVIPARDYKYDSKKQTYVSKKDRSKEIEKDRVVVVNTNKNEKVIKRYVEDRYRAIVINGSIVIAGKDKTQPRSNDDYSRVPLPLVGPTFNGITNLPVSLIALTMGLADTYNLLHLHREIILAISGVAGILIDMSQKPGDMGQEEWFHNMKLGRYLIQTVKEGRQVSSFNQFNRFDMSFSSSIQYIDGMIQQTDMAIGDIMGISPPRKGVISPGDQVGTQSQSRVQSELRTEIYFIAFEDQEREAFNMLINLYAKYIAPRGDIIELIGEDQHYDYTEIPENSLEGLDFSTAVFSGSKQEQSLHDLKLIAKQHLDHQKIPFHVFINMYLSESIVELRNMIESHDKSFHLAMQEQQKQSIEGQAAAQQRVQEMSAQLQMELKKIDAGLKEKELQLKAGIQDSKTSVELDRLEFEKKKWEDQKQLNIMEIVNQDKIETSVLKENTEARQLDQRLSAIKTRLDGVLKMMELNRKGEIPDDAFTGKIKPAGKKKTTEHLIDN